MGKGTELEGKRVSIPALMASGLIEVRLLYMWPCGWVAMNSPTPSTHTDTNTFPYSLEQGARRVARRSTVKCSFTRLADFT